MFSARGQQWLAAGLVLLCLLPFVLLAFDSHPALDDFSDAVMRRQLGFWGTQRTLYLGWTGRYTTSLLLMGLSPLQTFEHWEAGYFLVGWSALLALAGGLYALWTALVGAAWSRPTRALATGVVLALWLAQAPSVAECLYWYNAVAVYTWPLLLLLLWLVALLALLRAAPDAPGRGWRGLSTAGLAVAVVGCNEVLALVVLAGLATAVAWAGLARRQQLPLLLALLLISGLATAISFLAPGNFGRLAAVAQTGQVVASLAGVRAGIGAGAAACYLTLNWLGAGLLPLAALLALPALLRLVQRPGSAAHALGRVPPLWLAAGLLALLVLVGLPSYWATGGMMPLRARTAVLLLFIIGGLGLLLAGLGAGARRWPALHGLAAGWPRPVAALLWAGLLLAFLTDHNVRVTHALAGVGSNTVVLAYRDWLSGDAARYDQQQRARYQLLRAQTQQRLRLKPLAVEPPTLIYLDITTDSTYWGNLAYAQYFYQQAVWVGPGGHGRHP